MLRTETRITEVAVVNATFGYVCKYWTGYSRVAGFLYLDKMITKC